jgi:hypothetical protein
VQHEGVRIYAQLGDDERHTLAHEPGDEGHVPRQAIQLGNHDGALALAGVREGSRELRIDAAMTRQEGRLAPALNTTTNSELMRSG